MNTNSSHNTLKFHIIFENDFLILCAFMHVHMCTMKGMWKFVCVCVYMYSKEGIRKSEDNFWGGQFSSSIMGSSSGHWACVHLLGYLSCHKNFLYKLRLRK